LQLNVDGYGNAAFFSSRLEAGSERPGHFGIKVCELQALFLQRDLGEILGPRSCEFPF
jgi:hypothetical protein